MARVHIMGNGILVVYHHHQADARNLCAHWRGVVCLFLQSRTNFFLRDFCLLTNANAMDDEEHSDKLKNGPTK